MKFVQTLSIWTLFTTLYLTLTNAATFNIINQCNYTVWAAASPGGGRRLDQGQSWTLDVAPGTAGGARIWGRTNCNFDANGQGQCQTGDCGRLECQGYGRPPNTLAEFALNQPNNLDYIDISLVDGFNIPMEFRSVTPCRVIRCSAPIVEECPAELRTPGGCNDPCTVFGTNEYCCTNGPGSCAPTTFSRFFKDRCPDAYILPQNDPTPSLSSCPSGTNYRVVFCP